MTSKTKMPKAPDAGQITQQQKAMSDNTAADNRKFNNVNISGPTGSSTWTTNPDGTMSQNISLNSNQQTALDNQQGVAADLSGLARRMIGDVDTGAFGIPAGLPTRLTGLDASGKAIVLFDTKETKPAATQQPVVRNFWTLNQIPAIASMQDDLGKAEVKANFGPGPQKILFRTVDFPPAPPDEIVKGMDVNMFMKIAGEEAPKKGRPPVHPFTHRTKTIDFAVVMSGEIDMVLDDSTVHLKAGDVVVQQETNHAWVNRGKEVCRISFVQIEATEP